MCQSMILSFSVWHHEANELHEYDYITKPERYFFQYLTMIMYTIYSMFEHLDVHWKQ